MNIAGLKKVLPALLQHKIVPYLHGAQGIGKTSVIRQYCEAYGLKLILLYLATQDQGDLIGLLNKNDDGTVSHLPPEWMKEAQSGAGIIFLDEINRAHPDVLQVMFPFLQTGKIHRQGIGPGWKIIAAGNYNNNKFTTTDTSDTALLSRFCHIDVRPEVAEFCEYAETSGQESIASFLRDNPKFLISDAGDGFDLSTIPFDPRAWLEKVGPLLTAGLGDLEYEVIAGCIGSTAASSFLTYRKKNEKPISAMKVLDSYQEIRSEVLKLVQQDGNESRLDLLNTAISELESRLEKDKNLLSISRIKNLHAFLLDIPLELCMAAIKSLGKLKFTDKNLVLNDVEFCRRLGEKV